MSHDHQVGESASPGRGRRERTCGRTPQAEVLEAIMAGGVVAIAIAVFLGGMVFGVIAVVAIAVRREDRRYTLAGEAPDRLSRSTRRLTGVGRRDVDADLLRPVGGLVH